jgi:hypothetical protein
MMDISKAVEEALSTLTEMMKNSTAEGFKLEAAREILKYSAATQQ